MSFEKYCTGCGLCHSEKAVKFCNDEKGFIRPESFDDEFFLKYCPAGGAYVRQSSNIWGDFKKVYLGYSLDETIRNNASSGGVLTELALYLIENKLVDGIIQTRVSSGSKISTETVVSRSREDVLSCMGSRYSGSSPLYDISSLIKSGEVYAFIGKPCDVMTLRVYMKDNERLNKQIKYLFSFFCAGVPSKVANMKLLNSLGCNSEEECVQLTYRGNGWPGYATCVNKNGNVTSTSYDNSWGKYLGRDVRNSCKFCLDGIGDAADIACGDAWYLNPDNTPCFDENQGRNVVFARTDAGNELLNKVASDKKLHIEEYTKYSDELKYSQYYQYQRRATMNSMIKALKLFGKKAPKYDKLLMKEYGKNISGSERFDRFFGICKRIIKGKI